MKRSPSSSRTTRLPSLETPVTFAPAMSLTDGFHVRSTKGFPTRMPARTCPAARAATASTYTVTSGSSGKLSPLRALRERHVDGLDRAIDVSLGVSPGEERGLELRGRPVLPLFEHPRVPAPETRGVARLRVVPRAHGALAEEERDHRADALNGSLDAVLRDREKDPRLEPRP